MEIIAYILYLPWKYITNNIMALLKAEGCDIIIVVWKKYKTHSIIIICYNSPILVFRQKIVRSDWKSGLYKITFNKKIKKNNKQK